MEVDVDRHGECPQEPETRFPPPLDCIRRLLCVLRGGAGGARLVFAGGTAHCGNGALMGSREFDM